MKIDGVPLLDMTHNRRIDLNQLETLKSGKVSEEVS